MYARRALQAKKWILFFKKFVEAGIMKRFITATKVKMIIRLLAMCFLAASLLPAETYAFDPIDVPIVMYHKVDVNTPTGYWVSPRTLRYHMFLLHDLGYETVNFDDLYNHINNIAELPAKPVIVTFDDGYEGIYKYAMPVMLEFTEPDFFGVSHVITDVVGDSEATRQENTS